MSVSPDGDKMASTRRKQGDTFLLVFAKVKSNIAIKRFFRRPRVNHQLLLEDSLLIC